MKKIVTIFLILGMLTFGAGIAGAAFVGVTANVLTSLTFGLSESSLTFNGIQPGLASSSQPLTATTTGSGSYQLTLLCSNFTKTGDTQAPSVLQFKETAAPTYKNASAIAQNMLGTAGTATATPGDTKDFELRVLFPLSATTGAYGATVTIAAVPM